jgi:hypothetical protein
MRHSLWVASNSDGNEYKRKAKETWLQLPDAARKRWTEIQSAIDELNEDGTAKADTAKVSILAVLQAGKPAGKRTPGVPADPPSWRKQKQTLAAQQAWAPASSQDVPADVPDQAKVPQAAIAPQLQPDGSQVGVKTALPSRHCGACGQSGQEVEGVWDATRTQQWLCNGCWAKWQPVEWTSGQVQAPGSGHAAEQEPPVEPPLQHDCPSAHQKAEAPANQCGACRQAVLAADGKWDTDGTHAWFCNSCWAKWQSVQAARGPKPASTSHESTPSVDAFPGFHRVYGEAVSVEEKAYTRSIPAEAGNGIVTDEYAHSLIDEHLIKNGMVSFFDYLYDSKRKPQGLQHKTANKEATVNVYVPKGTVHISSKKSAIHLRNELLFYVSKWTEPKKD